GSTPTQAVSPNGEGDRTEGSTPTQAVSPEGEGDRTEGSTPTQAVSPDGEGDRTEGSTPTQAVSPDGEGSVDEVDVADVGKTEILYEFRRESYLEQHFEKHGGEFDYATKEEYLEGANRVIQSPDALHKIEAEDGDDIYYLEETNEFVVVSTDGYIRTYFRPSAGINYYNRQ
ncbi:MAG: hypothetical protein K2N63_13140, partial [Lachnospiraceae bacterium]|nr:hypothetical protein [Lachnospiraceae bacterium]